MNYSYFTNNASGVTEMSDWYERRNELYGGMVFMTQDGSKVMLDRRVPGDGTKWYVADWFNGSWSYEDATIEPGELAELVNE